MMDGLVRVLIVDDHPVVREGLAALVSQGRALEVVGQAGTGGEAIALIAERAPDVTLLDLSLPDMSGVEVIAAVRRRDPSARFLVLTIYGGVEDIYRALEAGARGYLLKDVKRDELLDAIRTVHAGGRCLAAPVASRLADRIGADQLTARELDVMRLLVEGMRDRGIARLLGVSEATVRTHITAILLKLGAGSRSQAIVVALQRGIVHSRES